MKGTNLHIKTMYQRFLSLQNTVTGNVIDLEIWIEYFDFNLINTYLLTPWCRVLLEKLTGLQLVKKFQAFHGTRRFITALTSFRHLSISCASPIQSTYPHPTSWRSFLILSIHLRLCHPSGLFPSVFPANTLYTPLSSHIRATCPAHLILLDFILNKTIDFLSNIIYNYLFHGAESFLRS